MPLSPTAVSLSSAPGTPVGAQKPPSSPPAEALRSPLARLSATRKMKSPKVAPEQPAPAVRADSKKLGATMLTAKEERMVKMSLPEWVQVKTYWDMVVLEMGKRHDWCVPPSASNPQNHDAQCE
jgi:hypothetical protein